MPLSYPYSQSAEHKHVNAAHDGIAYPMTVQEIIDAVDAALATGDRGAILDLAGELDALNNLGVPGGIF